MKTRQQSLLEAVDSKLFFQVVKAGFSAKRKKLISSISGGLNMTKDDTNKLLAQAGISPELRAEALAIDDWIRLTEAINHK